MKKLISILSICATTGMASAETSLTIYNGNFAIIRDELSLELKKGISDVSFKEISYMLESESVILRDKKGETQFKILEQSYRNDPVSQGLLIKEFEGKEIQFLTTGKDGEELLTKGKIIRSGYESGLQDYQVFANTIVETEKGIRFGLPGTPLFPDLGNGNVLKPELRWKIGSKDDAKVDAEISYISYGLSWNADYNIVLPEKGNKMAISAWITMQNNSGKTYENAAINLLAGEVNKIYSARSKGMAREVMMAAPSSPFGDADYYDEKVVEKSFDEFHLYTIPNRTTLLNKETKQIEFINVENVDSETLYKFNVTANFGNNNSVLDTQNYGADLKGKVSIFRKFKNTKENNLGIPLPAGKIRFYRENGEQIEFTGENTIQHTPKDEEVELFLGNAFDLVAERKQTDFTVSRAKLIGTSVITESIEFTLKNRKDDPVIIQINENLYRWTNWKVESETSHQKINANQIRFNVPLAPGEEKKVTYTVTYTW